MGYATPDAVVGKCCMGTIILMVTSLGLNIKHYNLFTVTKCYKVITH